MFNPVVLREEVVAWGLGSELCVLPSWPLRQWGTLRTRERAGFRCLSTPQQIGVLIHRQPCSLFLSSFTEQWCLLGEFFSSRGRHTDCCLILQKDFVQVKKSCPCLETFYNMSEKIRIQETAFIQDVTNYKGYESCF